MKALLTIFSLFTAASNAVFAHQTLTPGDVLAWTAESEIITQHTLPLSESQGEDVDYISRAASDNILLALHYLADTVPKQGEAVDWEQIRQPQLISLKLNPGEVFAFHPETLSKFQNKPVKAVQTNFYGSDGYVVDNNLIGNGVCYLASLMNWTASEAGLAVTAKINHDFFPVPNVPSEYGTSIFYIPGADSSQNQNLYIENTLGVPVFLVFSADAERVVFGVVR